MEIPIKDNGMDFCLSQDFGTRSLAQATWLLALVFTGFSCAVLDSAGKK